MTRAPRRPINHSQLFKRASQILGVPVEKLKPPVTFRGSSRQNGYFIALHQIQTSKRQLTREHEERHGLQSIQEPYADRIPLNRIGQNRISSETQSRLLKQYDKKIILFDEPTNPGTPNRTVEGLRLASFSPRRFATQILRSARFQKLLDRHGEDAVLLLWANPPKNRSGIPDALKIKQWENQMVQNGFLKPNGGFTRKGLQLFRQNSSAATVWSNLATAEKNRKLANIPKWIRLAMTTPKPN